MTHKIKRILAYILYRHLHPATENTFTARHNPDHCIKRESRRQESCSNSDSQPGCKLGQLKHWNLLPLSMGCLEIKTNFNKRTTSENLYNSRSTRTTEWAGGFKFQFQNRKIITLLHCMLKEVQQDWELENPPVF